MTYCAWVCDDGSKMRMYTWLAQLYLAVSQCDKLKLLQEEEKKTRKYEKILGPPCCNMPMKYP